MGSGGVGRGAIHISLIKSLHTGRSYQSRVLKSLYAGRSYQSFIHEFQTAEDGGGVLARGWGGVLS